MWRIVHLLGRYPRSENTELLVQIVTRTSYEWVQYGAIRSLLEHALISTRRQEIILLVQDLSKNIDSERVLDEIRRCSIISNEEDIDWYTNILNLLIKIESRYIPETFKIKDQWKKTIEDVNLLI